MSQLSLKECLEEMEYREYTIFDHEDFISYLFAIPTDACDYDFYDVNEFMINSGFYDHYIENGYESLCDAYTCWEKKVVPLIKLDDFYRFVLVRFSPSRDKFVIVADSANM